jgi:excisionase family DNA binding protein
VEVIIPNEPIKEMEAYAKGEEITLNEFRFWALGEKVSELRERLGVKNLIRVNPNKPPEKSIIDKAQLPSSVPNQPLQKTFVDNTQLPFGDTKGLLKAVEVAKYLRISRTGSYHLMQTGEISVVQIGKSVRVKEEDL